MHENIFENCPSRHQNGSFGTIFSAIRSANQNLSIIFKIIVDELSTKLSTKTRKLLRKPILDQEICN
jgi:hypothetical protein